MGGLKIVEGKVYYWLNWSLVPSDHSLYGNPIPVTRKHLEKAVIPVTVKIKHHSRHGITWDTYSVSVVFKANRTGDDSFTVCENELAAKKETLIRRVLRKREKEAESRDKYNKHYDYSSNLKRVFTTIGLNVEVYGKTARMSYDQIENLRMASHVLIKSISNGDLKPLDSNMLLKIMKGNK